MTTGTASAIREAALQLTLQEREKLAAELWDSLPSPLAESSEPLSTLLSRRIQEIDAGQVAPIPWEQARRMIRDVQ